MPASEVVQHLTSTLTNLLSGQVYHSRLVVSNADGVVHGRDERFIGVGRPIVVRADSLKLALLYHGKWEIPNLPATNKIVAAVAAAYIWTDSPGMALRSDGTAIEFGRRTVHNLVGGGGGATLVPPRVPSGFTNVAAIFSSGLALRIDGSWVSADGTVPQLSTDVISVSGPLALRKDGTVFTWQQGRAVLTNIPPGLNRVVQLVSSYNHAVALRSDGTVVAWGTCCDDRGELPVEAPAGLSNVVAVATGTGTVAAALRGNGTVVTWGDNFGQANVPEGLTNVVALASENPHLALRADGTVVRWGIGDWVGNESLLSNVVAVSSSGNVGYTLGENSRPGVFTYPLAIPDNSDVLLHLEGQDLNQDELRFHIVGLPELGALYQVENGKRGVQINNPGTRVTDPELRVIFAPATDGSGNPYASFFSYIANDGQSDSPPATITISTRPMDLEIARDELTSGIVVHFRGAANSSYRVWSTTRLTGNLADWQLLGVASQPAPGKFEFHHAVGGSHRFYTISTP